MKAMREFIKGILNNISVSSIKCYLKSQYITASPKKRFFAFSCLFVIVIFPLVYYHDFTSHKLRIIEVENYKKALISLDIHAAEQHLKKFNENAPILFGSLSREMSPALRYAVSDFKVFADLNPPQVISKYLSMPPMSMQELRAIDDIHHKYYSCLQRLEQTKELNEARFSSILVIQAAAIMFEPEKFEGQFDGSINPFVYISDDDYISKSGRKIVLKLLPETIRLMSLYLEKITENEKNIKIEFNLEYSDILSWLLEEISKRVFKDKKLNQDIEIDVVAKILDSQIEMLLLLKKWIFNIFKKKIANDDFIDADLRACASWYEIYIKCKELSEACKLQYTALESIEDELPPESIAVFNKLVDLKDKTNLSLKRARDTRIWEEWRRKKQAEEAQKERAELDKMMMEYNAKKARERTPRIIIIE